MVTIPNTRDNMTWHDTTLLIYTRTTIQHIYPDILLTHTYSAHTKPDIPTSTTPSSDTTNRHRITISPLLSLTLPTLLPIHSLPAISPSRLPTTVHTVPQDLCLTHPLRSPTFILCNSGKSFTDLSLPNAHIHKTTPTPAYMRPAKQDLIHADTIHLSAPSSHLNPFDLCINNNIIN